MSLVGKVAVVTGGTGNTGWQIAHHLLLQGIDKLAIFDIIYLPESIERLSNEFPKKLIFFRKTDVSNRLEVDRSFKEIALKFGRLDVLVNNAGLLDERELNLTIDVNLIGVINCTQAAIDIMSIERGGRGGIIANVASVCGLDALFANPIYTATKHAVVGFTRALGTPFYFNVYGIKFIVICPGLTATDLTDDLGERLYHQDAEGPATKLLNQLGTQTHEECGKLLADVLPKAKNGSIWMLNLGQAREVVLQNEWLRYN